MAIGTVLSGVGTLMQNQQAAADARKSAAWLREQAEFARIAGEREEEIFGRQIQQLKANQKLALAGSGVSLEGSVFEIEDQGAGFDVSKLPDFDDPESLMSSGRGLLLIHSFMDVVEWNDKGNCIKMIKHINQSGS